MEPKVNRADPSLSQPFPRARWEWAGCDAVFEPGEAVDDTAWAVIVFALSGDGFLLGHVPGRGWCTPSGRIEPGESPRDAALRETWEEVGATLTDVRRIGRYLLTGDDGSRRVAPVFAGRVAALNDRPAGSETDGIRIATPAELPGIYFRWDSLLERVFDYARTQAAG